MVFDTFGLAVGRPGRCISCCGARSLTTEALEGEGIVDRLAFPVSPFFEISALADDSDFNHFCENVFEWL